ncbi:MAG TPA: penicillin-binding protein 2, partial [Polyangiaceae bacterium]
MLVQRSDVGEFRRRYRWLVLVAIAAFGTLIGRLGQLQLVEGDLHRAQARRNIVRERSLATTRGVIRDAFGRVLAANRPSYSVHITPAAIDLEATWPRVMKVVPLDELERAAIEKKIAEIKALPKDDKRRGQQILLKTDVDRDVVAFLETHEKELDGVEVTPTPVRYYPYGELGAHAVGYMQEVDAEALERLDERGYRAGDHIGAIGIERRWESYLRGQRGWRKIVRGVTRRESTAEIDAKYLE